MARLRIQDVGKPMLARLAQQTGETANLSIWDGTEVYVIDQVIGPGPIQHVSTPGRSPVHCTATGKALLAASDDTVVEAAIARGLKRHTDKTIVRVSTFRKEIQRVRKTGYAINDEELLKDIYAIAAVVRGFDGKPCAAVSVAMPRFRLVPKAVEQLATEVTNAARYLSLSWGWRENNPT